MPASAGSVALHAIEPRGVVRRLRGRAVGTVAHEARVGIDEGRVIGIVGEHGRLPGPEGEHPDEQP